MTGEFGGGTDRKEAINEAKSIFEKVRNVPYVLGLDGTPKKLLVEGRGNCTRKHLYLANKLVDLGYKVVLGMAVFDWRELPIPEKITSLLKDPIDSHMFLYACCDGNESVIDATWDLQMPEGFVKNYWDGENSTQICVPAKDVARVDLRIFQMSTLVRQPLRVIRNLLEPKRPTPFNDAFNQWIGRS